MREPTACPHVLPDEQSLLEPRTQVHLLIDDCPDEALEPLRDLLREWLKTATTLTHTLLLCGFVLPG